jgi:hypothetical protein
MIHLRGLLGHADVASPVLDVASDGGPITFAQYLAEWGFPVAILRLSADGSSSHIECPDANATTADRSLSDGSYAAATLGEAILRVPKSRVPALCADVFRLLRVGGLFMVTIRIGDHALIDTHGRFVQYFRDSSGVSRILKQAGFDEPTVLQPGTTPWITLFARKSV